jgi:hypothetical protein
MSLGAVLDVAIGLVFTYLLLGILASGVQELFAGFSKLRGRTLRKGVAQLLSGSDDGKPATALFDRVFGHALITDLEPSRLPSYIPARHFALALVEALKDGSQAPLFSQVESSITRLPPGSARQSLTALVTRAGGDLDALHKSIETWFDDSMDRLSGAYKRFSQYFTLGFGLVVAVAFNVDTLHLTRALWTDPGARAAAVAAAQRYAETHQGAGDAQAQVEAARQQLEAFPVPVGWTDPKARSAGQPPRSFGALFVERVLAADGSGIWLVIGWLITALCVSLGAPFWFDALENLLQLRNSGPKPARATS